MSHATSHGVRPELIGALAASFDDMGGPSHTKLDNAINAAGLAVPKGTGNKPDKVRAAFTNARPSQARALVEQLVRAIRDNGYYKLPDYQTELRRTQAAVELAGGQLTDEGILSWTPATQSPAPAPRSTPQPAPAPPSRRPVTAATPTPPLARPGAQALPLPSHDRLLNVLRRLPPALKPLVRDRRVDQDELRMANEYDVQDAVEVALRLLYDDVRPEERGPSVAGGSTTPDFLLPEVQTAIEVKVTKAGRGNVAIRDEIIVDCGTYPKHPDVGRMVFAVYDLAGTIKNPAGFERDLSSPFDGKMRDTLVVEWPSGLR